ncbi:hypothetical protein D3C71_1771140 [compost metagenome]
MHGLLITLYYRIVPVLIIHPIVAPRLTLGKTPFQAVNKLIFSNFADQTRYILGNKECQLPGISFYIMFICSTSERIKILSPFPITQFHMSVSIAVDGIFPPLTTFLKLFIDVFFT